jgi:hypothetical protein
MIRKILTFYYYLNSYLPICIYRKIHKLSFAPLLPEQVKKIDPFVLAKKHANGIRHRNLFEPPLSVDLRI